MRERVSFTIAVTMMVLAVVFWILGFAGWNAATNQASVAPPTKSLQMM